VRPLNLKLKGFTSFRDEQEIDFTDLDLFVLWGPTGSGKSSLLDAITYALFGNVERVGNQVSQLVSHGQPRLSVTLEFAVGPDIYKVTRSTSRNSQSKALLERREGDSWESYGEGADLVREVNKSVTELIGLDYEAFTRSVILPQGQFAEFLSGDASKRREILTELLGLELFKRMSQRSNEIAKNAKVHFETKSQLLEREYAGIDQTSLDRAADSHGSAVAMAEAAAELEKKLEAIEKKWMAAETARKSLASCVAEVQDASETFSQAAMDLDEHAKIVAETGAGLATAKAAFKRATSTVTAASKKRATAEGKWGSLEDLAGFKSKAASIAGAREEYHEAVAALEQAKAATDDVATSVKEITKQVAEAKKAAGGAADALEAADAAHAAAHKKDSVGSLVAGLHPGDPCPVCERSLDSIPATSRKEIEATRKALEKARKVAADAAVIHADAEKQLALAVQRAGMTKQEIARYQQDVTNRKGRVDLLISEVSAVAGKADDPLAQIDTRIVELRGLVEAETDALAAETEAGREVDRRELAASKVESEIEKIRTRMASVPLAPIRARVGDAAPQIEAIENLPTPLPGAAEQLTTIASSTSKELSRLAEELEGLQVSRDRELEGLLAEARAALPAGLALDSTSITALVAQTRGTASQLKSDAAVAAKTLKDLAEKLETKARYEEEIEGHRREQAIYSALGKELRSDSIVQFLQAEALIALAQAATVHLQDLSSTRYRLSYEDDRFFVVDAWNGDERRNVKTLSGGETFQASLALALALSEQVQFLAVTERNRLDSLFLDEGFGTLDAETLEVVVGAIEQLGGDDRLVGVITHVPELAERIPIRIEVVKSQRGSSIRRAAEELVPGLG
jgi:exonuclease SbcC